MAPDRGPETARQSSHPAPASLPAERLRHHRDEEIQFLALHATEGQNFTTRGLLIGLGVGLIICFSNMYFGLQTGWVSSMSMPSSLIGFAFFRSVSQHLDMPFTPVENVLVQTVAGSMGTMPLGCGFVGVMPALNFLLNAEEGGPLSLGLWRLIIWALGLCFFGVVFAVPLRRQVIIREKLKFPSGTATALMISVLHGKEDLKTNLATPFTPIALANPDRIDSAEPPRSRTSQDVLDEDAVRNSHERIVDGSTTIDNEKRSSWKVRVRLLMLSFMVSGLYTLGTFFFPILHNLPVFGYTIAHTWLWTLNPSLAYVGQGIIMGPATSLHMLLGAVIGWAFLSPLAKHKGWAPGPVDDWENGSKGWIVWISLAIMLSDAVVSLGYIAGRPIALSLGHLSNDIIQRLSQQDWKAILHRGRSTAGYAAVADASVLTPTSSHSESFDPLDYSSPDSGDHGSISLTDIDAPAEHLVSTRVVWIGMVLSVVFCIISIHFAFGTLVPFYATFVAVCMALILSIMGVRALGETDLNPVSGISKLAQLFFALIIPQSNKNSVVINLIAGAVSEAGALQAGDLMQDLKTGHLLGAAPNAQFWGQIIGSAVGAVVSALIYQLYINVYPVPGDLFQVPTGYVWVFTARLVTGKGLPPMAWQWALGAGALFTVTTIARIVGRGKSWHAYIPGGIAVAIGMYNTPSFTLARALGGFMNWYWISYRQQNETPIVVLASGLILGEGVMSIVNLLMASLKVPHF